MTKITRLTDGLVLLCAKLRAESAADDGALFEKFGGSIAELAALRGDVTARTRGLLVVPSDLARLEAVLSELQVLFDGLSRAPAAVIPLAESRPVSRRKRQRALELDQATRKLLRRAALAVGLTASGAALIGGSGLALAGTCTGTSTVVCSGLFGGTISGIFFSSDPDVVTDLTVKDLTGSISTNANGAPGIFLRVEGDEGSHSATPGSNGTDGDSAPSLAIHAKPSAFQIITTGDGSFGVSAQSVGGTGGNGVKGTVVNGGAAGWGGDAGAVLIENDLAIFAGGRVSAGLYGLSHGGQGGQGGDAAAGHSGGSGGGGGNASSVHITNSASIFTAGALSYGIVGQSIGGNGGQGGNGGPFFQESGNGGGANLGGDVLIETAATSIVTTYGDDAYGIYAQSVGGFGGGGGSGIGLVSWGGDGSTGGAAGDAAVYNNGAVETHGKFAHGVVAQSIGGGGGSAGSQLGIVSLGGSGDAGGAGGDVTVQNMGAIVTFGDSARGVFAQSVGGGGGDGGSATGLVSVGGSGSSTSASGSVKVDNFGTITTHGLSAYGVFAQSVGGGGGNGGASGGLFTIGGSGGGGGAGGAVSVSNAGIIQTLGADSHAIFAQSVGGGGGNGGAAASASAFLAVAIGGSAGAGSDAAKVTINDGVNASSSAALIGTSGDRSDGIRAQSIGGGGGNGGYAFAGSIGVGGSGSIALGGKGGGGGKGGEVEVNYNGTIGTLGADANAITAQSIGGGGGNGGFAIALAGSDTAALSFALGGSGDVGGAADKVHVNTWSNITTLGDRAYGILASSLGGGGGDGGFSVAVAAGGQFGGSFAIGGKGNGGGDASTVDLINVGDVYTVGAAAHGLVAESIGGGGGNGGFAVTGAFTLGAAGLGVSLGGRGGAAGDGDAVHLSSTGSIETLGANSFGLFAQSLGGGGGNGGFSGAITGAVAGGAASLVLGGGGNSGGDGGSVTLDNLGTIVTHGDNAIAAFAQSVGGGGGNGGFTLALSAAQQGSLSAAIGGFGAGGGKAADVTLTSTGNISTSGALAFGMLAQSVGGGGGNGGFALSGSLAVDNGATSVSIGGPGGTGNHAGIVTVTDHGSISTTGAGAHGIVAQSVGGGGGTGGFAGSLSLQLGDGAGVSVALGGIGGKGSYGGDVHVLTDSGTISTTGIGAFGISAQSVGGSGGDGGFAFSASLGTQEKAINASVALGGNGGDGNIAGLVDVDNSANIYTTGAYAVGIFAQAIGGGGGNGGVSATGVLSTSSKSKQLSVSLGGDGGTGNNGGIVSVLNHGQVVTTGDGATAIFAQSVGGGGGNGGFSFSGALATNDTKQASLSIGGTGHAGGLGELVSVTNFSILDTSGTSAAGIFAQSVGGGGGRGGFAMGAALSVGGEGTNVNAGVTLGGAGGDGQAAGEVEVINHGGIVTRGADSDAIFAQSVGGGGGAGGGAFTALVGIANSDPDNSKSRTVNAAVTLGGGGGGGNNGGIVGVINDGQLDTFADASRGIFAQSIGGGGGRGGQANTMSAVIAAYCPLPVVCNGKPDSAKNNMNLTATIGGDGGGASDGGAVTVGNSGQIHTRGENATGIYAQSVGGGGGDGASGALGTKDLAPVQVETLFSKFGAVSKFKNLNVLIGGSSGSSGNGGIVSVVNSGIVFTEGDESDGIFAQSVGGGGGKGGATGENDKITIGGSGGSSGTGGAVTVNNTGSLLTKGIMSYAIFAESIGGGGGMGGAPQPGATGLLAIGGAGGAAGDGGAVTVTNTKAIETFGAGATAIFAHSVGGGGGVAGDVTRGIPAGVNIPSKTIGGITTPSASFGNIGIGLAFGGNGGGGGNGGAVSVTNSGAIVTHGDGAAGIFAQSVGGGGGVLGNLGNDLPIASLLNFAGSVGDAGSAGIVTVAQNGSITTSGIGAHGIFAQSAGGQGTGAAVNITVNGDIKVSGANADAIIAESVGTAGNGAVTIDIEHGTIQGSGGAGVGVRLVDGGANSVLNKGTITTLSGLSGTAVFGTVAADTINNFGTLIGLIDLGGGANGLSNKAGGEVRSGASIALGAGNVFSNAGLFSPGGAGTLQTTALTGNLTQTTGNTLIDYDVQTNGSDRVNVTGATTLGGTLTVNALHLEYLKPGDRTTTIVTATGGAGHAGLTLSAPQTLVSKFDLRFPDANTIQLGLHVDFASLTGGSLNANQSAVGQHINAILTAGAPPSFLPVVSALLGVTDPAQMAGIYDSMSDELQVDGVAATGYAAQHFTDLMFSCAVPGGQWTVQTGEACVWGRIEGRELRLGATTTTQGFREHAAGFSGGVEKAVGDSWRLGAALGYEHASTQLSHTGQSDGDRLQGGVVAKTTIENIDLALALTGGMGWFDTQRHILAPVAVASGTQDLTYGSLSLRAGRRFDFTGGWIKPGLEINGSLVSMDAFHETGAGPLNLSAAAHSLSYVRLRPSVEFGADLGETQGLWIRPVIKLGVNQLLTGDTTELSASFDAAPAGIAPFAIKTRNAATLGEISAAIEAVDADGLSVKLGYFGQFGSKTTQQGANLKVILPL